MLLEAAGGVLAKELLTRLGSSTAEKLVRGHRDARALESAVECAWTVMAGRYHGVLSRYDVNAAFLEHEGAREASRIMLAGRGPDARVLARACMRSLGGEHHARGSAALVAPFQAFLDSLAEELTKHGRFRARLDEVASTRSARTTLADELELLEWLCGRHAYLSTTGIGTTQHLQLPLAEVFVQPRVLREQRAGRKWGSRVEEQRAWLDERLRVGEIAHDEYEALLDRLGIAEREDAPVALEPVAVSEVLRDTDRVVILGDPGSGKTTLLRYLALRHAQALLDDDEDAIRGEFGAARLPLLVRAGDFARSRQRQAGIRAFVTASLCSQECWLSSKRLDGVIDDALRAGRCLVLIDGLDEVTTAQERASVVASITNFVGSHQPRGNRVICTSRISGYEAAPLPADFVGARLQEMDDLSVKRFLELYVPAIEREEAPSKRVDVTRADAQRTINAILDAFAASPGVRRLAANPLLLTALLLVQRTHGALPERRVDAYEEVTKALGHTWRLHQGVPESALPDERYLKQWLTRLADWMHAKRPEGSATLRDLLEQWGPLWAILQREAWDPGVLDQADPASTDVGRAIVDFVERVERHSGLLVERAPQRWGFPHLTFEEYYAGRALAYEGRASERAARIRQRLHDPRYDEPILLALGLIGAHQTEGRRSGGVGVSGRIPSWRTESCVCACRGGRDGGASGRGACGAAGARAADRGRGVARARR